MFPFSPLQYVSATEKEINREVEGGRTARERDGPAPLESAGVTGSPLPSCRSFLRNSRLSPQCEGAKDGGSPLISAPSRARALAPREAGAQWGPAAYARSAGTLACSRAVGSQCNRPAAPQGVGLQPQATSCSPHPLERLTQVAAVPRRVGRGRAEAVGEAAVCLYPRLSPS